MITINATFQRRSNLIYLFILLFSGIIVYYPILENQLLYYWDDQWVVMNSYTEGGFAIQNMMNILTEFYHGQYAPLNEFLYLVLYNVSDYYNPILFHLASLFFHLANVCLTFIVIGQLLTFSRKLSPSKASAIAFLTALIFCLHPLNVESVAWMSASKVLVYTLFYLLGTYTFLLYLKKRKIRFYFYTIILYVLSFLGKEQAVVFPLWMLLICWFADYKLLNKKVWLSVLPFFVLSLFLGILTIYSQYAGTMHGIASDNYPLWQRIVFACYSLMEYLFKIVLPFKLSYLYPFPSVVGEPLPDWLLMYPTIILVILITLWKFLKQKPLAFGLLFFIIHIIVALHIIPLSRFAIVADRYAYLSIIGIAFILAFYIVYVWDVIKRRISYKTLIFTFAFSYLLYLGAYAHQRTYVWYNVDTLKKELRDLLKQRNDYVEQKTYV